MTGFWDEAIAGLEARPKRVSPKYLYDERGSELFERICEVPEYYPTRTELGILEANAGEIARALGAGCTLYEFGSGSSRKVRLLLDAFLEVGAPEAYVPIDISSEFLAGSAARVSRAYPGLRVLPLHGDFTRPDSLIPQAARLSKPSCRAAFFPGSTIGNFDPEEAQAFLAGTARFLGRGGHLVVGVDLVKDVARLEAAYDDAQGVTRDFNLNLLARMNRELGADFDLSAFEHRAFFDPAKSRIEMHLVSRRAQRVRVQGRMIAFEAGESIHTECSYKYTLESFGKLAHDSGFEVAAQWTDPEGLFAVFCLASRVHDARSAVDSLAVEQDVEHVQGRTAA